MQFVEGRRDNVREISFYTILYDALPVQDAVRVYVFFLLVGLINSADFNQLRTLGSIKQLWNFSDFCVI